MELNVWTNTTMDSCTWDPASSTWNVAVTRGGEAQRTLRPRHVIQATGHSGEPHMPDIPGLSSFRGAAYHSSKWPGTVPKADASAAAKSVVIVGSCNSAHDIAHAYASAGYTPTMVQRSTTCVVSSGALVDNALAPLFAEGGPPADEADLVMWSWPAEALKANHQGIAAACRAQDAATLRGLQSAGFGLDYGPDGCGLFIKYLQRGGGYYIDVGASALIVSGKIKIKHGVEVARVGEDGVTFSDGTEAKADELILATGYTNMRTQTRRIFGDKVADAIGDAWGFDKEGEIRTLFRKTGHPGFWVCGGNLAICRYFSRMLALQIKALEEGLVNYEDMS
jgi:cation diffusion facilitator CzcD-associated flavoprotein CzcO